MRDFISDFIDAMSQVGIYPASTSEITASGKIARFNIAGDRPNKKNGRYKLTVDGDRAFGWFIDSKEGVTHNFHSKAARKYTDEERREWVKKREEEKRHHLAAVKRRQAIVKKWSNILWNKSSRSAHVYLARKGISGIGSKVWGKRLLIPIYKNGEIINLQIISENGFKRPMLGGEIKGCYGSINTSRDLSTIYICEGYATGASIQMATWSPVIIAFNAGNLKLVALAIRKKYPEARIIIAADHDQWTEIRGEKKNIGRIKAGEAAEAIGAEIIWPDFPENDADKRTDFNDYHAAFGLDAVKNRLREAVSMQPTAGGPDSLPVGLVADTGSGPPSFPDVPIEAYDIEEFKSRELTQAKDWRELLIVNGDKIAKGSLKNIILFLENHEDFKDIFRQNDFQKEIFVCKCPIWESESEFQVHRLEDNDITQAAAALERHGIAPDVERVFKAIRVVAEKNGFHPAREYFDGLVWDKTERLKNWLSYYMGAEDDDPDYLAFVGRKWLTAAVKRVYEPGCKFDHVLVMEGKQGRGKSTAFEFLATFGREKQEAYFTDNIKISDIQNKDTILLLQGSIIVELAELAGFKKKDDDEIKGWITVKEDRCRKPYGKTITHFARQFVLCATTNNYDYLKDPTGNRRYWPFKSNAVDLESIQRDREQLWAEAVHLYKEGLYIGPTEEEMKLAETAQEKRRAVDTWEDDVLRAVDDLGIFEKQNGFKTNVIFKSMGLQLKDQDYKNTRRITNILQMNGYSNEVRWVGGRSQRVWIRMDN